ncbi:MAG: hypothetical protein N3D10_01130 [Candidatus Micrarchaeota archaeon]|nr:hypothetical protein [Candidatus Micrarchaeota archaeon]
MKKIFFLLFALFLVQSVFCADLSDLYTKTCPDGTKYWQCSKTKPGYACLPDYSKGGSELKLQNDLQTKLVKDYKTGAHLCACENFPGYTEKDGECVKINCDYQGKEILNGACLEEKPKRCVLGSIVDDPLSCGCPQGKEISPDKKSCQSKVGCRWGTLICQAGYNCEYVESNPADDGKCVAQSGCSSIIPPEKRISCTSLEECDTSTDPKGICVPKKGCQYLNPPCPAGEVCDKKTGICIKPQSNLFNSPSTTSNSTKEKGNSPLSNLSCCCLPSAGFLALLFFSWKNKNNKF